MQFKEVAEVCRLCLTNENLVRIFDEQLESNESLKDVIILTTGVEVDLNDPISQKICKKCMRIVIKMKQFRVASIENNSFLKNKYKELVKNGALKTANSTIKIQGRKSDVTKDETTKKAVTSSIHPSVERAFLKNPDIRLPKNCLALDIAPFVEMILDEVETYFKQHNRNIRKHTNNVLKSIRSKCNEDIVSQDPKRETNNIISESIPGTSRNHEETRKQNSMSSSKENKPVSESSSATSRNHEESLKGNFISLSKAENESANKSSPGTSLDNEESLKGNFISLSKAENQSANKSSPGTSGYHDESLKQNIISPSEKKNKTSSESPLGTSRNSDEPIKQNPSLSNKEKNKIVSEFLPTASNNHNEPTTRNPISPINIKLTNPEKTEYMIVKHKEKNEITGPKRKSPSRDNSSDRSIPTTSKKRKMSESSTTSSEKKENMPANVIESVGLIPIRNNPKPENESPVQISYVQRTLEICNICNSVQYSLEKLKRHKLKHLRCHFCKAKFKTIAYKEEHIRDTCIIKKVMNSLPNVELQKIEYNLEIRRKYPCTFAGFPSISGLAEVNEPCGNNIAKTGLENNVASTSDASTAENKTIADNDKTTGMCKIVPKSKSFTAEKSANVVDNHTEKISANHNVDIIEILSDEEQTFSNKVSLEETCKTDNSAEQQHSANNDAPVVNSSSIIKPKIKIKNSGILNRIDRTANDLTVMTELLKNYEKLKITKDTATQSKLPSNNDIKINHNDGLRTTIFTNLCTELYVYRIPVEVKNGTFKVTFNNTPKQQKTKNMCDWSHLTPFDLKTPANKITVTRSNSTPTSTNSYKTTQTTKSRSYSCTSYQQTPPSYPSNRNQVISGYNINQNKAASNVIKNTLPNNTDDLKTFTGTTLTNTGYNVPKTTPVATNVPPNSSVLVPPNLKLGGPTQKVYNDNTRTSEVIPHSRLQIPVLSTQVTTSSPITSSNSVTSVPVISVSSSFSQSSVSSTHYTKSLSKSNSVGTVPVISATSNCNITNSLKNKYNKKEQSSRMTHSFSQIPVTSKHVTNSSTIANSNSATSSCNVLNTSENKCNNTEPSALMTPDSPTFTTSSSSVNSNDVRPVPVNCTSRSYNLPYHPRQLCNDTIKPAEIHNTGASFPFSSDLVRFSSNITDSSYAKGPVISNSSKPHTSGTIPGKTSVAFSLLNSVNVHNNSSNVSLNTNMLGEGSSTATTFIRVKDLENLK